MDRYLEKIKNIFRGKLVLGIFLGIAGTVAFYSFGTTAPHNSQLRLGFEGFVNPLIACGVDDDEPSSELKDLEYNLESLVNDLKGKNKAERISVYFRDMDSGHWVGVDENETYAPASLVKVPLMMAYFKGSEFDSSILSKKLNFLSRVDENEREFFKPNTAPLSYGQSYTVDDLIYRMIVHSGNNSYKTLLGAMNKSMLTKIYLDLDLSIISDDFKNLMSPKSYSMAWRALYNASYLSKEMSNRAPELLSRVEFREGIMARLPFNLSAAHKFGERTFEEGGSPVSRQLHDCGIIYYPEHPYYVCVMTEGSDFNTLKMVIQDISLEAYKYVDDKYKKR